MATIFAIHAPQAAALKTLVLHAQTQLADVIHDVQPKLQAVSPHMQRTSTIGAYQLAVGEAIAAVTTASPQLVKPATAVKDAQDAREAAVNRRTDLGDLAASMGGAATAAKDAHAALAALPHASDFEGSTPAEPGQCTSPTSQSPQQASLITAFTELRNQLQQLVDHESVHESVHESDQDTSYQAALGKLEVFAKAALKARSEVANVPRAALDDLAALGSTLASATKFIGQWQAAGQPAAASRAITDATDIIESTLRSAVRDDLSGALITLLLAGQQAAVQEVFETMTQRNQALEASGAGAGNTNLLSQLPQIQAALDEMASVKPLFDALARVAHDMSDARAAACAFKDYYTNSATKLQAGGGGTAAAGALETEVQTLVTKTEELLGAADNARVTIGTFTGVIADIPILGPAAVKMSDFILVLIDKAIGAIASARDLQLRAQRAANVENTATTASTQLDGLCDALDGRVSDAAREDPQSTFHDLSISLHAVASADLAAAADVAETMEGSTASCEAVNQLIGQFNGQWQQALDAIVDALAPAGRVDDLQLARGYIDHVDKTLLREMNNLKAGVSGPDNGYADAVDALLSHTVHFDAAARFVGASIGKRLRSFLGEIETATSSGGWLSAANIDATLAEVTAQQCLPGVDCARVRLEQHLLHLEAELASFHGLATDDFLDLSTLGPWSLDTELGTALQDMNNQQQGMTAMKDSTTSYYDSHHVVYDVARVLTLGRTFDAFLSDMLVLQHGIGPSLGAITRAAIECSQRSQLAVAPLQALSRVAGTLKDGNLHAAVTAAINGPCGVGKAKELHDQIVARDVMNTPELRAFELLAVPARIAALFHGTVTDIKDGFQRVKQVVETILDKLDSFAGTVSHEVSRLNLNELKDSSLEEDITNLGAACGHADTHDSMVGFCLQALSRSASVYRDIVFPLRYLPFCSNTAPAAKEEGSQVLPGVGASVIQRTRFVDPTHGATNA